ncbi:DUF2125 domain-containing protein [Polycladidibacter hongkongensis]|uniref:DUF2125 domain-containing protein n=1 Tax=Polycladidibacter hongkongensis TaxID=1647556 RepID=UPI000836435A|nr:DUF2125 domain-containing protein [Pseudovibrio hongkongensis]
MRKHYGLIEANYLMSATQPSEQTGKRAGRKYLYLGLVTALVVGGWSLYWDLGSGVINDIYRNGKKVVAAQGGELVCGQQEVSGYPFQFRLDCQPLRVETALGWVEAAAAKAMTLAYNPQHVIVDMKAPISGVVQNGPGYSADFASTLLSARLGTSGINNLDGEAKELTLSLVGLATPFQASVKAAEVHIRRATQDDQDMQLAASLSGLLLETLGIEQPVEGKVRAVLKGGAALLSYQAPSFSQLAGSTDLQIVLENAKVIQGELSVSTKGTLKVRPNGQYEGTLPITVKGVDQLEAALLPFFPEGSQVPASVARSAKGLGGDKGEVTLPITFSDGRARLVFFDLGPVPPLF